MENVSEASLANWQQEVSGSKALTLVYFWHQQCTWCQQLNPIFERLTQEYRGRIRFVKLNILANQDNRQIATNLGVMSTPTMMFFCRGRPIGQGVGYMPEENLRKIFDFMLQTYQDCLTQSSDLRDYIA